MPGIDSIDLRPNSLIEKRWLREPVKRDYKDIEVEVYHVSSGKFNKPNLLLSARKPLVKVPVEPEEPLQFRFRHIDGFFWTAWSPIIPKSIPGPPFELAVFKESEENKNKFETPQQFLEAEKSFFNNLSQELLEIIKRFGQVDLRFLGRIGTGKSSLINTLFYAFTKVFNEVAPAYGRNKSVTRFVDRYELISGNVCLIDTPGAQKNTPSRRVGEILQGVYDGMEPNMSRGEGEAQENQEANQTPGLNEGPGSQVKTAVIVAVSAEDTKDEDDVNRKIIKRVIKKRYPCIVVVTKVDRLFAEDERPINQDNFYTDARVVNCCNKLKSLGVQYIVPMINYKPERQSNHKIDYVALHILVKALQRAR